MSKKLEEYGLLEVAGEKQVGNLIEKSYRRNNEIDTNVILNEKMMSENKSELIFLPKTTTCINEPEGRLFLIHSSHARDGRCF